MIGATIDDEYNMKSSEVNVDCYRVNGFCSVDNFGRVFDIGDDDFGGYSSGDGGNDGHERRKKKMEEGWRNFLFPNQKRFFFLSPNQNGLCWKLKINSF